MRHLGGTPCRHSLHTPCSLSGFFLFLFLFMLPMFTRSTTFCWSSTNHQAFCLRFVCVFSLSPSSTLQRLISHVVVLVLVAGVLRFLFRYAYTAVFDFCVCDSLCAGKTCSHAVHLNFLCPVPCPFSLLPLLLQLVLPFSSSFSSSRAFVVSVNWRILKTHKIALCLLFHFGFFSSIFHSFPLVAASPSPCAVFSCFRAAALAYPPRRQFMQKAPPPSWCIWRDREMKERSWGLLCCKQLQHVSLFHSPVPAPAPSLSLSACCRLCLGSVKYL